MFRRTWNIVATGSARRNFATTIVLRIAPNPDRMSPETVRKVKDEDKADIERERKLREQFASKIQGAFGGGGGGSSQQGSSANSSNAGQGQQVPNFFPASLPGSMQFKVARVLFFGFVIYVIIMLSNLRNPNSPLMQMQGQPWWQAPTDALVLHSLIRSLVSFREQRTVKGEYEAAVKQNPNLTLAQFLSRSYPALLSGYRTSQQEITAALMAVHTVTRDLSFLDTVNKATQTHPRDPKAAVDKMMESLKTEFPQIFAPLVPNPQWQQPQQYQQQQPLPVVTFPPQSYGGGVPPQQPSSFGYPPPHQPQQFYQPPPVDQLQHLSAPLNVVPQPVLQPPSAQGTPSATTPQTFVYNMTESATSTTK
ncbi:transmembrane protein, putative [Bodo saltans]|uniref:Transmembrane protein, putative n=1 Tax=Bodo saltans TaxID=75058 RepID=A0A0S4IU47_BODSA|nr:transmembrane protein, putative [Bodo saltans]|eukprot:CUF84986.1 transmembrane protein, putative [Bodo saltans]